MCPLRNIQAGENVSGGAPRLEPAEQGFSVYHRGRALLSRVDPLRQAERAALQYLPLSAGTLYLLPSPLLGYGIPLVMQNLPSDSALLCVEVDPALYDLSAEHIGALETVRDDRFRFVRTENPAALAAFAGRTWGCRRFRRVEELRLTAGWQLNADFYGTALGTLRRAVATEWSNVLTLTRLGRRYMRNAIRNLCLLAERPGVESLDFGGCPVIVLGAGPSLDTFLDRIEGRRLPSACRILCVDTALRPLKERNIRPDLVVALEAQHWNLNDFSGTGDWRIPVAMDMSALPATGGVLGGETYMFWTRWTDLSVFERLSALKLLPAELPPLGSVGLSAVSLALRLGTGPIFTAGMDFAFTLDKYHCRGSPSHGKILKNHTRFGGLYPTAAAMRAHTVADSNLYSDPAMENYRRLFGQEFTGGGRVFAIAGSGLDLGVETLPYDEAMRLVEATSTGGVFSTAGGDPAVAAPIPSRTRRLRSFVEREEGLLYELLGILKGEARAAGGRLDSLLDEASYLWAHFPDCAGGSVRPTSNDIIFLKRVRVEIEPFIRVWEYAAHRLLK
ncbi:MAG: DUF115 domain-containing protein [Spirochaetaceae bacterium]|jgi:hypothetical protein|nr:DUF115 domain-containing protein [Spirochaetaceae bacterium]